MTARSAPPVLRLVTDAGVEVRALDELTALLAGDEGTVWLDIPHCDGDAAQLLQGAFGFHPLAVRDCAERNRVPRVHAYTDHVLLILHAPEAGAAGHVHYIELDQMIGPRYLVTVHGPVNPGVSAEVPQREVDAVVRRLESGRLRPATPHELSYALVSELTRHQESYVESLTSDVWQLEQRVTAGQVGDPEQFLEELFRARHGLMVVRTMSAMACEAYGRIAALGRFVPPQDQPLVDDVLDQFERVRRLADGQKEYLQGVIEFYRTRTETKMTIAAERLAVIAVITLPITALSSVFGMNLIVNGRTQPVQLSVVLAAMGALSVLLLRWAKRQGWW